MFFSQRTFRRITMATAFLAVYIGAAAGLSLLTGEHTESFGQTLGGWMIRLPVALVAIFTLEMVGINILGLPIWNRMPAIVRVASLIAVIALLIAGSLVLRENFAFVQCAFDWFLWPAR